MVNDGQSNAADAELEAQRLEAQDDVRLTESAFPVTEKKELLAEIQALALACRHAQELIGAGDDATKKKCRELIGNARYALGMVKQTRSTKALHYIRSAYSNMRELSNSFERHEEYYSGDRSVYARDWRTRYAIARRALRAALYILERAWDNSPLLSKMVQAEQPDQ